jgi:hypothetical protein
MTPIDVKLLNGESWVLHHLDTIVDRHPGYVALAILYLFVAFFIWLVVGISRQKAQGKIRQVPPVIIVQSSAPPSPPPEEPFNPFPPMRDVDYEIERLRDEGYLDD